MDIKSLKKIIRDNEASLRAISNPGLPSDMTLFHAILAMAEMIEECCVEKEGPAFSSAFDDSFDVG
jgi:hypothetical protein